LSSSELEKEPLLKKARWYNDRNRTYKACLCYLQILQQNPEHRQCVKELAALYFDRGDYEQAVLCLEHLVSREPGNQDYGMKLVHAYMHLNRYTLAWNYLVDPSNFNEHMEEERVLSLSQCELNLGNPLQCLNLLSDLIDANPMPFYFVLQAETLENLGMHDVALEVARRGLKRDPYYEELLSLRGRIHLRQKDFKKAREVYLKMIKNQLYLGEAQCDIEYALYQYSNPPELVELMQYFDDFPLLEEE